MSSGWLCLPGVLLLGASWALGAGVEALAAGEVPAEVVRWRRLPPVAEAAGLAGAFAGVDHDVLIVAGGATFSGALPRHRGAEPGRSSLVYQDRMFAFSLGAPGAGAVWSAQEKRLRRPLAYGASVSTPYGLICLGGEGREDERDAPAETIGPRRFQTDRVWVLRWDRETGRVVESDRITGPGERSGNVALLPRLPGPVSHLSAALAGETLYVVGGTSGEPGGTHAFWSLDLSRRRDSARFHWRLLEPWPGSERALAVVAAQHDGRSDCLFVFGGRNRTGGHDAILKDAYKFEVASGVWSRLSDVQLPGESPRGVMAGNGFPVGANHIVLVGGAQRGVLLEDEPPSLGQVAAARAPGGPASTGGIRERKEALRDPHPGFSRDILLYNTVTDAWSKAGAFPGVGSVTTPGGSWREKLVLPPGEGSSCGWLGTVALSRRGFGVVNWSILGGYLAALVWIGVYFSRRESSTADFFLAGGRIPWWAAGLSLFSTQLSAITFLSMPARAYTTDWVLLVLNSGILLVVPVLVWVYLPVYRRRKITSVYEFLEQRFHVSLRLLGSATFVAFQLGRMGIVILLPALALSAVTGLDVFVCIVAMGILSTVYTVLGGMEAVVWTDVVQSVVLVGGAIVALVLIVFSLDGGVGELVSVGWTYHKLDLVHLNWDWSGDALVVIVLGALFTNALVPYTTDQAVVQRYFTTRTEKAAAGAIWINGGLSIVVSVLFLSVGTGLFVFFKAHPDALGPLAKNDQVFAWFIANQLPNGISGLVIAGVFAAAMSSLDSSMHSVATAVTTDFVRRFRPRTGERACLRIARLLVGFFGVLGTATAMVMATMDIKSLWDHWLGILGLLGGGLGGLFLLGVLTKRVSALHAWLGAASSFAVLGWVKLETDLNGLLYGAIGVLVCVAVALTASGVIPSRGASAKTQGDF